MQVRILYFAAVRELVGLDEEVVELPLEVRTIGDVLAWLELRPNLRGQLTSVRMARNEAFAKADALVAAGDVLAVIPPVAGG